MNFILRLLKIFRLEKKFGSGFFAGFVFFNYRIFIVGHFVCRQSRDKFILYTIQFSKNLVEKRFIRIYRVDCFVCYTTNGKRKGK